MSAAPGEPRQRAVMATDSEWERVSKAAAAAGMEKSRYVIHRTLGPERHSARRRRVASGRPSVSPSDSAHAASSS